jgi:S-(hydroxymethyl)glutathione dehydrogenase/alcohol dehydrogenase
MRAAVMHEVGQPMELRDDVEVGAPESGEVRVRIVATSLCHSDLSVLHGTIPHPLPCILGHEGAGEIVAVGDDVVSVTKGDRVIIAGTPAACGSCRACMKGHFDRCLKRDQTPRAIYRAGDTSVFSLFRTTTFVEETVVPAGSAIPIDDELPLDLACLLSCAVTTGLSAALNTAQVRPGSSVVVFGCGGVGISVIQGARICGAAEIVAVDLVEERREAARRFGATHTAYPDGLADLSAQLTGGAGFDYSFEAIGRVETIQAAWEAAGQGGTVVVIGTAAPDAKLALSPFELLTSGKRILGSLYTSSSDVRGEFDRFIRLWRAGRLDLEGLITARIDLREINDAFGALERGEGIRSVVQF